MINPDTNTLFLVLVLVALVISLLLAIVGKGVDKSLLIWSVAFAFNGMAYWLIWLRGLIPDLASIWLANLLVVATYSLCAFGLLTFTRQRMSPFIVWSPLALIALMLPVWFDVFSVRVVIMGIVNCAQIIVLLMILISANNQLVGRGKLILAFCFIAGIGVTLIRPFSVMLGGAEISSFNTSGSGQAFTFLSIITLNIVLALAFVLMQKEQAEAAIDSLARSDELTGLPNRRRLYERLAQVAADRTSGLYGGLIMLDLDNFKTLNDRYGHAAGDELLKQAASRLLRCVTYSDTVARLGGDEFVVMMPDLAADQNAAANAALALAEKIKTALAEPYQLNVNTNPNANALSIIHQSTATLGISIFKHGVQNRENLLRDADKAMYNAKNQQRGSIQLADNPSGSGLLAAAD